MALHAPARIFFRLCEKFHTYDEPSLRKVQEAQALLYKLVLTDKILPGRRGEDALGALRKKVIAPNLPLRNPRVLLQWQIIMTNHLQITIAVSWHRGTVHCGLQSPAEPRFPSQRGSLWVLSANFLWAPVSSFVQWGHHWSPGSRTMNRPMGTKHTHWVLPLCPFIIIFCFNS